MAAEDFKGDSLRQRLVGGIALLVIGVVAWFWLLSADSPVDPVERASQIPPAPAIESFETVEPAAPADIAPIGSERELSTQADSAAGEKSADKPPRAATTESKTPTRKVPPAVNAAQPDAKAVPRPKETFALDQHGLPAAWVVQVGLFSSQAGAEKVKATLQQKGFKAYTEAYRTAAAPNGFKVFVGPKLSRERADEQKKAIDAALKVNSKVVRFQPPAR